MASNDLLESPGARALGTSMKALGGTRCGFRQRAARVLDREPWTGAGVALPAGICSETYSALQRAIREYLVALRQRAKRNLGAG
eukprot:4897680-Pyramimonas_sp.AAC.1